MSQIVHKETILALGANIAGNWGGPAATIRRTLKELEIMGFQRIVASSFYHTRAWGTIYQPSYKNLVVAARCDYPPHEILKRLKRLERAAGRRLGARNGPRPLDLDLIDWRGRLINWPQSGRRPSLVLPHPLMATRAFVLVPLMELRPDWRHPATRLTARQLLLRCYGRLRDPLLRRDIRML